MLRFDQDQRKIINAAKELQRDARKAATRARPKSPKADRGRERDTGYLAFLRRQPCVCGCGRPAPSDAAHIRMGNLSLGKLPTGMQVKPSDRFAVPLNRDCHTTQHSMSEARFWSERGLDPFTIAATLFSAYQRGG
ncbi:DUF968 domain-containing protein [Brevundimonas sp. S30B]|uniref:DUF968 domain-containing protein n=1 Tax=unclassified Brevundimonas TaxID=2622653 RepID=UPI0010725F74|nr:MULTISPECIES: DUF968 domain-containing protein [unclassified Brevundimonas]QBX38642.1 DUF968 domain-containing protein [Brevundimonas sp. MF30-B]TFW01233.1 DUF968 domain-containing protein [Brevundimonas sp. S30B]